MRSEEAKCFLGQGKGWPECNFPSLKYPWLQCGTALLAAVEFIISFVSDSTPSQSFHSFTNTWKKSLSIMALSWKFEFKSLGFAVGSFRLYPG